MVNVILDDIIFVIIYGKSCFGQKLKLDFIDILIKYWLYFQMVIVFVLDKYGIVICKIFVNVIGKMIMVIY